MRQKTNNHSRHADHSGEDFCPPETIREPSDAGRRDDGQQTSEHIDQREIALRQLEVEDKMRRTKSCNGKE